MLHAIVPGITKHRFFPPLAVTPYGDALFLCRTPTRWHAISNVTDRAYNRALERAIFNDR